MGNLNKEKAPGNLNDPRLPYSYCGRECGTIPADTTRRPFRWVSEIAYKNLHRIVSRGYDTTELVESGYGLADILFIDYQARIPLVEEAQMLNYVMILGLEDGLSSPAVIARTVAKGNSYLTQAAGASILAFGNAYGAYCTFGTMMKRALERIDKEGLPAAEAASQTVRENLNSPSLGISRLMLKDPAAKRMFARAENLGVAGRHIALMKEMTLAAQAQNSDPVDLDMLGAIGATMLDLGFTPESTWAIMAVTRAFACGAHWIETIETEPFTRLGETLTPKEDYVGIPDRKVPPVSERGGFSGSAVCKTPEEWKRSFVEKQKQRASGWAIVEEIEDVRKI